MSKPKHQDVAAKLDEIKAQYFQRVRGEVSQLSGLFRQSPGKVALADAKSAYAVLHRLAGSAGTFGLHDLSRMAAELEQQLKPVVEAGSAADLAHLLDTGFRSRLSALAASLSPEPAPSRPILDPVAAEAARTRSRKWVHLIRPRDRVAQELSDGLSRYGFALACHPDVDAFMAALGCCSDGTTAAVITDEVMASRLVTTLRARTPRCPDSALPIIVLSTSNSFAARYRSAEAGAGGFFYGARGHPPVGGAY
ncbi:Hpt domain-containing protein [Marinobacter sp. X15-166B]|uniref:Hpt domain-containing protein n=1 Tax=Marinobacter sp. X15-166B TaxID=1897620 RepID=UPI00130113C7|nr:Hpt domain-containing protein [Marinobacter sp. X15-166B]